MHLDATRYDERLCNFQRSHSLKRHLSTNKREETTTMDTQGDPSEVGPFYISVLGLVQLYSHSFSSIISTSFCGHLCTIARADTVVLFMCDLFIASASVGNVPQKYFREHLPNVKKIFRFCC